MEDRSLVMGSYGFGNIGDRMILRNVVERYQNPAVTCFKTDWLDIDARKLHYWSPRVFIEIIRSQKLVVGGEPVLDNVISDKINALCYYILFALIIGRLTGSKIILESIGFYSYNGFTSRALKLVDPDEIRVRDSLSARKMSEIGLEAEIVEDPAVRNNPASHERKTGKIGINLRETSLETGNVVSIFRKLVDAIEPDYHVEGFSTQPIHQNIGLTRSSDEESDHRVLAKIGKNVEETTRTIEEVENQMSEFDMFIGMRLHSVITAYNHGVPTLAISYHPKVKEFCESKRIDYIELEDMEYQLLRDKTYEILEQDNIHVS